MSINLNKAAGREREEYWKLYWIRSNSPVYYMEMVQREDGLYAVDSHPTISSRAGTYVGSKFSEPFRDSAGREFSGILFEYHKDALDLDKTFFLDVSGRLYPYRDFSSPVDRRALVDHFRDALQDSIDDRNARWSMFEELSVAYGEALPTDEVPNGFYAYLNDGKDHWSRALDFSEGGVSSFSGLRYLDFEDFTDVLFVRRSDGEAVSFNDVGTDEMRKVVTDLRSTLSRKEAEGRSVRITPSQEEVFGRLSARYGGRSGLEVGVYSFSDEKLKALASGAVVKASKRVLFSGHNRHVQHRRESAWFVYDAGRDDLRSFRSVEVALRFRDRDGLDVPSVVSERLYSAVGRMSDYEREVTVRMTTPQRLLFQDMYEGMMVALERGTLPAFLKDAGMGFSEMSSSRGLSDVVAGAAVRMYGDGSLEKARRCADFVKGNEAVIMEGRHRKDRREADARKAWMAEEMVSPKKGNGIV